MTEPTGLLIASDDLMAEVDGSLPVCSQFTLEDVTGWERYLDPKYDPENWGHRLELQNRNDCRANAGTACAEVLEYRFKAILAELSRMFFYQSCEIIDGKFGADSGVSVQSGVKLLNGTGCPTEAEYPYDRYTRRRSQFEAWCSDEIKRSAATRKVVKSSVAPEWEVAIAHVALGHPLDMASYWSLSFEYEDVGRGRPERVVRQYTGRHGNSGHAYAGVFVVRTPRGELLLKVHNSHNYYFYVCQRAYEQMRDRRNNPFGMYQHAGVADPVAAHYDGKFNILGIE